jgi:hypothetical protein
MTYRVQVWAFCGYDPVTVPTPLGTFVFALPLVRWIDVYAGPNWFEAETTRAVYASKMENVRLLKLEKV